MAGDFDEEPYLDRLGQVAASLCEAGGTGWAFQEPGVPSVVSTTQGLHILRVAERNGVVLPTNFDRKVGAGVRLLVRYTTEEMAPLPHRSSRRPWWYTREIVFGMTGLNEWKHKELPGVSRRGVADGLEACASWLALNTTDGSLPELPAEADDDASSASAASILETSLAIMALAQHEDRHAPLIRNACDWLLFLRCPDEDDASTWPLHAPDAAAALEREHQARFLPSHEVSVAMTAQAALALNAAARLEPFRGVSEAAEWEDAAKHAGLWLIENRHRWMHTDAGGRWEEDPLVPDTHWWNASYSLAMRACVESEHPLPAPSELEPLLRYLDKTWREKDRRWKEGVHGPRTLRATHAAIRAYEALKRWTSRWVVDQDPLAVLNELRRYRVQGSSAKEFRLDSTTGFLTITLDDTSSIEVPLVGSQGGELVGDFVTVAIQLQRGGAFKLDNDFAELVAQRRHGRTATAWEPADRLQNLRDAKDNLNQQVRKRALERDVLIDPFVRSSGRRDRTFHFTVPLSQ